jgi:hypothetical protein
MNDMAKTWLSLSLSLHTHAYKINLIIEAIADPIK